MGNIKTTPLTTEQFDIFESLTQGLDQVQLAWVNGYYTALLANGTSTTIQPKGSSVNSVSTESTELTILYGSRTGNGESVAEIAKEIAKEIGLQVKLKNMETYKVRELKNEQNLLIIVSTHGEGEPPFEAKELHDFIFGKRAPKLENTKFAVVALGDSSYLKFCQTGNDFDNQLQQLGADRVADRVECDVDFNGTATEWLKSVLPKFKPENTIVSVENSYESTTTEQKYSKNNPYQAEILDKLNLHGRGSDRTTLHIELDANLAYSPGDSLGVLPVNSEQLVQAVLSTTKLNGNVQVLVSNNELSLYDALRNHFELSKITIDVLKRYNEKLSNEHLKSLLTNKDALEQFVFGLDIVDLFEEFPMALDASELIKILRPIQPRLYSIASSAEAVPGEVHLTVGVVDFEFQGRSKRGACSGYLESLSDEVKKLPVFIEKNNNFKLPKRAETPIIMVGAGTGIAPFRAFVQQRELADNPGKSWLFFGNRNFENEFLYQTEWQAYLKSGALTKLDVAFSRDTEQKVYVQHKLAENSIEIYKWLQAGAHFYICGDMKKMAGDVQTTLHKIVATEGAMSTEQASEYLTQLQREKRLQLDVY